MAKDKYGISGIPWHVESVRMAEKDDRRHRSRCVYFQKEKVQCTIRNGRCIGSAHCTAYHEEDHEENTDNNRQLSSAKASISQGDFVSSARYGTGIVTAVFPNGNFQVDFLDGSSEKVFFKEALLDGRIKKVLKSETTKEVKTNTSSKSSLSEKKPVKTSEKLPTVILLGDWETVSSKNVEVTIALAKVFDNSSIRVDSRFIKVLFWNELLKNKKIVLSLHKKDYKCTIHGPKDMESDFAIQPDCSFWGEVKRLCKEHTMITLSFTFSYKGVYKVRLILCDE